MVLVYSGLNLNQDKATKPQIVQIVRQGEVTPYWFKVNPLYKSQRFINHYLSLQAVSDDLFRNKERSNF